MRLLPSGFALIAILALPRAYAAEPETLPLDEAIKLAQSRTRGVIRARADVLLADVEKMTALSAILPRFDLRLSAGEQFAGSPIIETRSVGAQPGQLPVFGPFADGQVGSYSNPQFRLELTGRQLIYDGGRWWTVIARAEDLEVQTKAALRTIENDVRLEAARRFYELEKAQRSVRTFEEQIKVDEEQLARVKALLQAGMGKQNDVATVERNLAEDRITLAQRAYRERAARRVLNTVLGRPAETPLKIVVPDEMFPAGGAPDLSISLPATDRLLDEARTQRPELVSANVALEIAQKDVRIAAAEYWPVISLQANYSRQSRKPGRIFDDPTQNYYAGVGLDLAWNLFAGRATQANVERAELALSKVRADFEDLERVVGAEVQDKHDSVGLFVEVYKLAVQATKSAEEAVRLARGLYEQGRGTLLELRDAELRLTLARLAVQEARLDLEIAREELRRAVGADLPAPGGS